MLPLSAMEKYIRTHLRFNVTTNLIDGTLFGLALGFASFSTIIPLFVTRLTDSAILIGLAPAFHAIGWQLPQLFNAGHIARARKYKPMVLKNTIHERAPFLVLAMIAFLIPWIGVKTALVVTFIALAWQGIGGGFTANPWTSLVSKIIPPESRGTFFGVQGSLVNLAISVSAIGAGYLLDKINYPYNFAFSFLFASFALVASYIAIARTREPEDTEKIIPEEQTHFWQGARAILTKDRNFNWFLVVRFLSQFATMGFGFYILLGIRRFDMDTITAGYLTAALTLTQTFANAGMGWLGDRIGHRSMLILGAVSAVLSSIMAWFATSIAWLYPAFILSGFANVAVWTIGITFTVGFGSEAERPTYIGLSNTLITPATVLAPILGGVIIDSLGFQPAFGVSAFLGMLTVVILIVIVKDPPEKQSLEAPSSAPRTAPEANA
ncbi:MAG TPA: MFS transporter [Anaerolineales bacterium]|nr:MFS transporter [Anaerolineales bacterium]